MIEVGLILDQSCSPASYTLVIAILLLIIGVTAIISRTLDVGVFDY